MRELSAVLPASLASALLMVFAGHLAATTVPGPAMAADHRSAENKARDQYRHPLETLTVFALDPDGNNVEAVCHRWPA
jgi:predicted methyltransferase